MARPLFGAAVGMAEGSALRLSAGGQRL